MIVDSGVNLYTFLWHVYQILTNNFKDSKISHFRTCAQNAFLAYADIPKNKLKIDCALFFSVVLLYLKTKSKQHFLIVE